MSKETIHLLVFELEGQGYGLDVEQVEAVVEAGDRPNNGDQPVPSLAAWVGLAEPAESPPRLLLSRCTGKLQRFGVDTPVDIISLPLSEVYPIPALIRRVLGPSPLWGVGRTSRGLLLLVDLAAPTQGGGS